MMTQLPSVFELMVGTRSRRRSSTTAPGASTPGAHPTSSVPVSSAPGHREEPSSPSSIPRISSATSLPQMMSASTHNPIGARKWSSIPEDDTRSHAPVGRRRTEPSIVFGHPVAHIPSISSQPQQYGSMSSPRHPVMLAPPAIAYHHPITPSAGPHVYSPTHPNPPHTTGYLHPHNPHQPDYFPRHRASISSSIDSLSRTNSSNGPLTISNGAITYTSTGFSPGANGEAPITYTHSQQFQHNPAAPPPPPTQGATSIIPPQAGEYFPVIYGGVAQSQVIYPPLYQAQHPAMHGGAYAHLHASSSQHQHQQQQQQQQQQQLHQQQLHQQHAQLQQHQQQVLHHSHDENNALINKRRIIKRRTRTGCLTCRKRRIKCDERKPHCFNCERSKKVCLGYETMSKKKPGQRDSEDDDHEEHDHDHDDNDDDHDNVH